jgi:hypothetical protein
VKLMIELRRLTECRSASSPASACYIGSVSNIHVVPVCLPSRAVIIPVMERVLGPYLRGGGAKAFNFQVNMTSFSSAGCSQSIHRTLQGCCRSLCATPV